MIDIIIMVVIGGDLGEMKRELIMIMVKKMKEGFKIDIIVENVVECFIIGKVNEIYERKIN